MGHIGYVLSIRMDVLLLDSVAEQSSLLPSWRGHFKQFLDKGHLKLKLLS